MDTQQQRARLGAQAAQNAHHGLSLVQVEPVEWLVERQERLRRHQGQSDQQPLHVALRQRTDTFLERWPERQIAENNLFPTPLLDLVQVGEEIQHLDGEQLAIR